jgi:phosphoglycerol transferase MdoB-like AlkP superfamily enzyme
VGDHAYYPPQGNFRAAFHIPLLIYAPGIVEPKQNNQLAAQIDILPTIIEALGFQDAHASMGKSFQNPSKKRWAVVKYGSDYGLFAADYLFLSNLNGKKRLYSFPSDPLLTKDIKGLFPELAARYEKYLLAYLQEVTMSIKQDRIYKE